MEDSINLENLLRQAKSGDEQAAASIYEKLAVRFAALITKELQRYEIVRNAIQLDEAIADIGRQAMETVKALYPLHSPKWSFQRAINVLHNIVDDFILNTLVPLAQYGDLAAEDLLFQKLRQKLIEYINKKRNDRE
ncbi:MAG: hypothetical protein ONB16_01785 [candidate division KSB1 bacterium]|nr:hypothetical protein [candidate division KSB1 bacterium]MDZ7340193.1 hypothetical protein [candidate division KSB1 bacterium]